VIPVIWLVRVLAWIADSLFTIGLLLWGSWSRRPQSLAGTVVYVGLVTAVAIGLEQIGRWWMRNAMADHVKARTAGAPRLSLLRVGYLIGMLAAMVASLSMAVTLVYWLGPFLSSLTAGR
jgi:hypothetical protein